MTWILALFVFGCVVSQVVWALTVRPSPSRKSREELMRLLDSTQPAGTDGWPDFTEANNLFSPWFVQAAYGEEGVAHDAPQKNSFDAAKFGDAGRIELDTVRAGLEEMRELGIDDALARAAAADRLMPIISMMAEPVVEAPDALVTTDTFAIVSGPRRLLQSRVATLRFAAADGDWTRWVEALDAAVGILRALRIFPNLFNGLLTRSNEHALLTELRWQAGVEPLPREPLLGALASLDRIGDSNSLLATFLRGELVWYLDIIDVVYTGKPGGRGRMIPSVCGLLSRNPFKEAKRGELPLSSTQTPRIANLLFWRFPGRVAAESDAERLFAVLIADSALPRSQRAFDVDGELAKLAPLHPARSSLLYAHTLVLMFDDRERELRATRIMLAIELYRLDHGSPPPALNALAPAYLAEVPADPIASDGAFRYVLDPAAARGYTLYSVGALGFDHGPPLSGSPVTIGIFSDSDDGQDAAVLFTDMRGEAQEN